MKSKLIVFALASIPFSALAGLPTPGTLPKNGNCPSGYGKRPVTTV
ncbi:MAG: hypothetical protein ACK5AJ_00575 [bacterium]